ncbi:hypothetical protein BHE74_00010239 [Ensete ventricosum]|nr:hypothetical protein BHE74_00010239 [Ensete ventricosum]
MTESYGGRAAAAAWGKGVVRHTTLMSMEPGSVIPGHLHLGYQIDCRPGPSVEPNDLSYAVLKLQQYSSYWTFRSDEQ